MGYGDIIMLWGRPESVVGGPGRGVNGIFTVKALEITIVNAERESVSPVAPGGSAVNLDSKKPSRRSLG